MKVRVTLYVGGTTFEEFVHVAKFEDAKKTAFVLKEKGEVMGIYY